MSGIFKRACARFTQSVPVIILVLTLLQTSGCRVNNSQSNQNTFAQNSARVDPSSTNPSAAQETSQATLEADAKLTAIINREIDEGEFSGARWGILVLSLRDGRTVYARNAEDLVTPASVMKIYTTAAALDILGVDYRWRTSVYAATEPNRTGTIEGDLTLYGRGSPDLSSRGARSDFADLADQLYARGVRRVGGRIIGDESYFRGETLGSGWLWEDAQWYYGAEPSALSVDGNELTLSIAPADKVDDPVEVKLIPPVEDVRITNDARTVERGARPTLGVTRALSANEVRVWGDFPVGGTAYGVRLSIYRPALHAVRLFREALRARGIEVKGETKTRDARAESGDQFEPSRAVELAHVLSRPLVALVRDTNKESLNLQAELILRTLGRERGAEAPDPDPRKTLARNTDAAGIAVIRQWLERIGVNTQPLALHDGSGLSRLDLVTPDSTARLLAYMSHTPVSEPFRNSLPVAGRDGTLGGRMRGTIAEGRVFAKTGSLVYVNGLAGYATTADNEPLAFVIFCNNKTQARSALRTIDSIVLALTKHAE